MLERQYAHWRSGQWLGAGPHHFYSGNASVQRDHLIASGGFNEELRRQEDVELAYRLQSRCGTEFVFEPAAVGIHRPSRSLAAWLSIAEAYGRADVVRAQSASGTWDRVRDSYTNRNAVTRALARLTLAAPCLNQPLSASLVAVARVAYGVGLDAAAIPALSVVYNLCYLEAARGEMDPDEVQKLLKCDSEGTAR